MAIMEDQLNTVMADAFKKINLDDVKLVSNELSNGLTLEIINNLVISHHAKKRYKERFVNKNDTEIDILTRDSLKKSKYCGLVPSSDGNESHLYAYGELGIHISKDFKCVNTYVNYKQHYLSDVLNHYSEIKEALIDLQMKEMKKLTRTRKKMKKKTVLDKLDVNIRIAELERLIYRTKSETAKQRYIEEKDLLVKNLKEQEEYLVDIESKLRKVGGALAYLSK